MRRATGPRPAKEADELTTTRRFEEFGRKTNS